MKTALLPTIVIASLCALGPSSAGEDADEDAWRVVESGAHSNIVESTRKVIQTEGDWRDWWQRHNTVTEFIDGQVSERPPPAVDFSRETVLVATLGRRSSGGYAIEFNDVRYAGGTVIAVLKTKAPGPEEMVTMALTAPYAIIAIPRHEGPIEFRESSG